MSFDVETFRHLRVARSGDQIVGVEAEMDAVEEPIRGYFKALNNADPDGVAKVFTEDGALLPDEGETVTGREAIRAMFRRHFAALRFQRELHIDRVRQDGDTAVAETHTTGTITVNGTTLPVESRELFILRRSQNGWEISDYMFNRPANAGA